jgi:antitoxin component YwqK of YwqJK toxin-antitoxin module
MILFMLSALMAEVMKNGIQITYYKDGSVNTEISYKNGKLDGISKQYYPNGVIRRLDRYSNGEVIGISKKYYDNGTLESETKFKKGASYEYELYKTYYKTGILKKIHNQKLDITYYPNGQIAIDGNKTYPSGDAFTDVYKVMYFPMREPIDKKERKKMVGKPYRTIEHNYDYRHYGVNGDIRKMIPYRDDKKNGLAISRPHGKPYIKVTIYKDGKKDGYETLYRRGGVLTYEMIQNLLRGDITLKELNLTDEMVVKKTLYKKGKKVNE